MGGGGGGGGEGVSGRVPAAVEVEEAVVAEDGMVVVVVVKGSPKLKKLRERITNDNKQTPTKKIMGPDSLSLS